MISYYMCMVRLYTVRVYPCHPHWCLCFVGFVWRLHFHPPTAGICPLRQAASLQGPLLWVHIVVTVPVDAEHAVGNMIVFSSGNGWRTLHVSILGCVYETIQCINQQNNITAFLSFSGYIYQSGEHYCAINTDTYPVKMVVSCRITSIGSMIATLADCDLKKLQADLQFVSG